MKVLRKLIICLIIFCVILQAKLDLPKDLKMAQFISSLIKDSNDQDQSAYRNVVLLRIDEGNNSDFFDIVTREIIEENSFNPIINLRNDVKLKCTPYQTASFIFILSDITSWPKLNRILDFSIQNCEWGSTKFIFIPTGWVNLNELNLVSSNMCDFFYKVGAWNSIVLTKYKQVLVILWDNSWEYSRRYRKFYTKDVSKGNDIKSIFPDKLRNLNNYVFNVLYIPHAPRIYLSKKLRILNGIDVNAMEEITKRRGAHFQISHYVSPLVPDVISIFTEFLNNGSIDLSLSTIVHFDSSIHKLINTYDENGYCALIPIPARLTFWSFILKPFDWYSWGFMVMSIAACSIAWKLLKRNINSDSPFYFIFGVVATFVGQSIPFRNIRGSQQLLLQLCILMTFIMGNAFESLIIASMSRARDGVRFKSIEKLLQSNNSYVVDPVFHYLFENSEQAKDVVSRMELINGLVDYQHAYDDLKAVIARCDILELQYYSNNKFNIPEYFYFLPEKFMPFYEKFPLKVLSNFYEMLQKDFNTIFESGLRQHWNYYVKQDLKKKYDEEQDFIENEEYFLKMVDIQGIFSILIFAYLFLILVFMCECIWGKKRVIMTRLLNIARRLRRCFR